MKRKKKMNKHEIDRNKNLRLPYKIIDKSGFRFLVILKAEKE